MTVELCAPLFLVKGSPGVVGYAVLAVFALIGVGTIISGRRNR